MLESSWMAAQLAASQEGLSSVSVSDVTLLFIIIILKWFTKYRSNLKDFNRESSCSETNNDLDCCAHRFCCQRMMRTKIPIPETLLNIQESPSIRLATQGTTNPQRRFRQNISRRRLEPAFQNTKQVHQLRQRARFLCMNYHYNNFESRVNSN
jgi:hypothetical protein